MGAGRPKKYSAKQLKEAVERYFRSISRTVPAKDGSGRKILNDDGEQIMLTEFVIPPSISGLCLFLGIDRRTWSNYASEENQKLANVAAHARQRIEAYLEEELLTRRKGLQGVIFNLQNNYGWKQKQEVELGEKTRKDMGASNMSLEEKLNLIRQAAAEMSFDGASKAPPPTDDPSAETVEKNEGG